MSYRHWCPQKREWNTFEVIEGTSTSRVGAVRSWSKEVNHMAASLIVEEESGVTHGWVHSHNGYYAGDFSLGSFQTDDSQPSE